MKTLFVRAKLFWAVMAIVAVTFASGYAIGRDSGKAHAWRQVIGMVDENPSKVYRMATGNYLVVIKGDKGAANGR